MDTLAQSMNLLHEWDMANYFKNRLIYFHKPEAG